MATGMEEVECASLKALLDAASVRIQECKALLRNPTFRLGAQRTIDELLPATAWAQLRIKELRKAGAP
jgi:hypothetical protein